MSNRMSVNTRQDFLEFLEELARVSTSSDTARDKKAQMGKTRFTKPPGKCHLLSLPPELRNAIYQTLYPITPPSEGGSEGGSKGGGGRPLSPTDIENPDPTFLLTCRQIHHEARGYYEQARGHLWMDSNFLIRKDLLKPHDLAKLNKNDLNLITRVQILNDEFPGKSMLASLVDFRGGWRIEYVDTLANSDPRQQTSGVVEFVVVHQRLAGVWRGMTWTEFHATREKMEEGLSRMARCVGMRDQILQILLVGPEEVKRIAVRTFWRNVGGGARVGGSGTWVKRRCDNGVCAARRAI